MLVSPAPAEASPPSQSPLRVVGGVPFSRTWSGAVAAAERRKARYSRGRNDKTREGKAECEWRASQVLLGPRAPAHQRPLETGKEVKVSRAIKSEQLQVFYYLTVQTNLSDQANLFFISLFVLLAGIHCDDVFCFLFFYKAFKV